MEGTERTRRLPAGPCMFGPEKIDLDLHIGGEVAVGRPLHLGGGVDGDERAVVEGRDPDTGIHTPPMENRSRT